MSNFTVLHFRGTKCLCDAKLRDAWRGGGHGAKAADGGGGVCCDDGMPNGVRGTETEIWHEGS